MVSRFWHIKSISDACLKINTPDVLFHKHRVKKPMKDHVPVQQLGQSGCIYPSKKNRDEETFLWALSYAHMCINTQPPTHTHLHTSTVFCLWNWKCDVTWTMTGVFVKDVAVTSNQWTGASSQRDFPLLRVWLVTLRFTAGWRTVSCQSGIRGVLLRCHWIKKEQKK